MRWLFLFVLSLNLAYIAWEVNKSPSGGYEDVPALKNVKPIVLLSELTQQAPVDSLEPVAAVVQKNAEPVSSATASGDKDEHAGKQAEIEVAVLEKAPEDQTGTVDEEIKQPEQADAGLDKDEPVKTEPVKASVEIVSEAASEAEAGQTSSCYTIGPFLDLDRLRGLTREIKPYVVKTDFRGREEKEPTLYWVYIKPEKNRKQAVETGKRLKSKKIKDFYVIREGAKENGLSLGHFRNKDGAYGLAAKVQKLGFDVSVEPVRRTYTLYWLDYQLSTGAIIPASVLDKYTKSAKKGKISRMSRECDA